MFQAAILNLARSDSFRGSLRKTLRGHVAKDGEVVRPIVLAGSVSVFVHLDIEAPVQPVFDAPMSPGDGIEALGRERLAEQVVGGFARGLLGALAGPGNFGVRLQPRPLMLLLQPLDVAGDKSGAGLDPAMIAIDRGVGGDRFGFRIVEEGSDVVVQRALIALQRHGVVAALRDDLAGDAALAVERVHGHDRPLEAQQSQQLGYGGDLVGLGVGGDLPQHQLLIAAAGRDHVQRRLAARLVERSPHHLAVDRNHPLAALGEARHEPLEAGAKLLRRIISVPTTAQSLPLMPSATGSAGSASRPSISSQGHLGRTDTTRASTQSSGTKS